VMTLDFIILFAAPLFGWLVVPIIVTRMWLEARIYVLSAFARKHNVTRQTASSWRIAPPKLSVLQTFKAHCEPHICAVFSGANVDVALAELEAERNERAREQQAKITRAAIDATNELDA